MITLDYTRPFLDTYMDPSIQIEPIVGISPSFTSKLPSFKVGDKLIHVGLKNWNMGNNDMLLITRQDTLCQ